MFKKLIVSILLSLVVLTSFVTPARAETWFNQDPLSWYKKVYDTSVSPESEIFGERYTAAQVQWVFYSVLWIPVNLVGEVASCAFQGQIQCIAEFFTNFSSILNGLGGTTGLNQQPSNPVSFILTVDRPFSGISYVRNTLKNLKVIPEAQAQVGFGFGALDPVQDVWRGFRDISYVFLIFSAIILAFMIMFRVKISPQVVISAQSAIPKLITAIVLITFSFAIAGFMVDVMYVVIGIVSIALTSLPLEGTDPALYFGLMTRGFLNIGLLGEFVTYYVTFIVTLIALVVANFGIPGIGIAAFLTLIVIVVGALMLIWFFFKTFFALLKSFANILLLTIFAPLQILFGTVVESLGFTSWVKNMASHLAVFVVVGLFFQLSKFFLVYAMALAWGAPGGVDGDVFDEGVLQSIFNLLLGTTTVNLVTGESLGWPPLLGNSGSGTGTAFLMLGVSYVIFSLIPKTAEVVQGLISGRPFAYGSAVGESIGVPGRMLGTTAEISKTGAQLGAIPGQITTIRDKFRGITNDVTPASNNSSPRGFQSSNS